MGEYRVQPAATLAAIAARGLGGRLIAVNCLADPNALVAGRCSVYPRCRPTFAPTETAAAGKPPTSESDDNSGSGGGGSGSGGDQPEEEGGDSGK
jgi:hypothetical protein